MVQLHAGLATIDKPLITTSGTLDLPGGAFSTKSNATIAGAS